tara:strand:- start:233 stop:685 length:453 start_codon:yes stop_codon:yes gene_type:complete
MPKIRITKQFSFETGHALYGHDGKCKNIHGHSYRLNVTLFGTPIMDESSPKFGMIMDFSDLKKIVKETVVNPFDHSTIFNKNTPHSKLAKDLKSSGHKVVLVNYQPTSEMLVIDFAERIKKRLPANVRLHALKLRETASCYAEWYASDNE